MAARVPANRKSAAENTAPRGLAAMAWRMASDVRMSEIMHVFRNFSNRPAIRFVRSHLPVATMAASPTPKKQKRASKLLVVTNQCGPV
jgi:hypothetical protein